MFSVRIWFREGFDGTVSFEQDASGEVTAYNDGIRAMAVGPDEATALRRFYDAVPLVWDDLGPFDRYLAELVCVDMAGGIDRGGRWVHVERSVIVPA